MLARYGYLPDMVTFQVRLLWWLMVRQQEKRKMYFNILWQSESISVTLVCECVKQYACVLIIVHTLCFSFIW
jgi:hypothetical protein